VLQLLIDGFRSPEIAESLCITKKTAAPHIEHILAKLGAHTQAQAIAFAIRDDVLLTRTTRPHRRPRASNEPLRGEGPALG
jgi:NADPH-dependent ferric siderophore reductase